MTDKPADIIIKYLNDMRQLSINIIDIIKAFEAKGIDKKELIILLPDRYNMHMVLEKIYNVPIQYSKHLPGQEGVVIQKDKVKILQFDVI